MLYNCFVLCLGRVRLLIVMRFKNSHLIALIERSLSVLLICQLSSTLGNFCQENDALPYHVSVSSNGTLRLTCKRLQCFFDGKERSAQVINNNTSEKQSTKETAVNSFTLLIEQTLYQSFLLFEFSWKVSAIRMSVESSNFVLADLSVDIMVVVLFHKRKGVVHRGCFILHN